MQNCIYDDVKNWENLANAIILQAVTDWREAIKNIKKYPLKIKGYSEKLKCEKFFRSMWFECLTKIDGKLLLEKLRNEVTE